MSAKSEAGKREWEQRRGSYGAELRAQIEQAAAERKQAWADLGRVPVFIRLKARLRGAAV
ncbi:MAG: hypothetical protein ACRDJU_13735 [Actinomycetota bacterium]